MLNLDEHEILNAYQYKILYQEIQHFSGSDKPRMLYFLPINVKMPTHKEYVFCVGERKNTNILPDCTVVVALLFYVHGKHLRSCRDGQLT